MEYQKLFKIIMSKLAVVILTLVLYIGNSSAAKDLKWLH